MFNFSEWLKAGIIDGYKKGHTPFSKVTELTAAYFSKGLINEMQVEEIGNNCPIPTGEIENEEEQEAEI